MDNPQTQNLCPLNLPNTISDACLCPGVFSGYAYFASGKQARYIVASTKLAKGDAKEAYRYLPTSSFSRWASRFIILAIRSHISQKAHIQTDGFSRAHCRLSEAFWPHQAPVPAIREAHSKISPCPAEFYSWGSIARVSSQEEPTVLGSMLGP